MRHGENHVRLQALHRAPSQQPSVVKPEGRPAASVKPGQESSVIKSISAYTLTARSLVKHLEGNEASDRITPGSPLWKEAQREVRQHWFIYSYIAAYIQALYMYSPVLLEYIRLV